MRIPRGSTRAHAQLMSYRSCACVLVLLGGCAYDVGSSTDAVGEYRRAPDLEERCTGSFAEPAERVTGLVFAHAMRPDERLADGDEVEVMLDGEGRTVVPLVVLAAPGARSGCHQTTAGSAAGTEVNHFTYKWTNATIASVHVRVDPRQTLAELEVSIQREGSRRVMDWSGEFLLGGPP
jgi:hypothetical protein